MALSEFGMIARLFAPLAGEGAYGLLDDAASLAPTPGHDLVLTKDALVEGVHFFGEDLPESIARKALRVNLSDLAAKGARPRGFLLALARAPHWDDAWLTRFARGLGEDIATYGATLLGGDTVRAPTGMIAITALGEVPSGAMVRRQGGAPGDRLYVTGTIGDAALGLALRRTPDAGWARALTADGRAYLLERYLHPAPRMALAPVLLAHASAAMDISDGLIGDGEKLASTLGRSVEIARVPLSPAAQAVLRAAPEMLETMLTGGDDYEIFAAVPPAKAQGFEREALRLGVSLAYIGQLEAQGAPNLWRDASGQALVVARKSYSHF